MILVVDWTPSAHRLALGLRDAGWDATVIGGVDEAIERVRQDRIDLLVTEWRFPDALALDLVTEARQATFPCPVLVLTAFGTVESALICLRLGALDYLTKPATAAEIIERLRSQQEPLRATECLSLEDARAAYIREVLEEAGSVAQAARMLGLERRSLRRMMDRLGLRARDSREPLSALRTWRPDAGSGVSERTRKFKAG